MTDKAATPEFFDMFCELRAGTLAASCGLTLKQIRPGSEKFIHWLPVTPDKKGIWHKVSNKWILNHTDVPVIVE